MALLDKISRLMGYFDTDDVSDEDFEDFTEYEKEVPVATTPKPEPPQFTETRQERTKPMANQAVATQMSHKDVARNAESRHAHAEVTTIDIKFPKKYEEAREIVNLLLQEVSVLIDFQHMTDSQARRCIDYLDGARFVLDGNLKKISSTMWLLTPANVVVNIEDMGLRGEPSDSQYDFDMKRR
ncbi:cell division protein SepF [Streptococcus moroccensis]|uniref:Cell division protein SepF n=1 Tax=Streptococcus moroccensis TaxID=1451356 RepID=A0ABT9YNC4_9STRE|nr:cell division protein SepF [Streptococcus moroccensis]MDQ0221487.1 cell division inhibitor SepF [Streptococcus moroccensis]